MHTPVKSVGSTASKDKDKDSAKRLARCGKCTNCKSSDCGNCFNCYDKPKFGGPGIKKQACINRKCLLMVPRDEDGEKLARKRAKQRAIVPGAVHLSSSLQGLGADSSFLAGLNIQLPTSPTSAASMDSPRSATSSPSSPLDAPTPPLEPPSSLSTLSPDGSLASVIARKQQWSEESLFALALDDDASKGKALSSAMLFAAIRTPAGSPQRSGSSSRSASARAARAAAAAAEGTSPPDTPTRRAKRSMSTEATADEEEDEELKAAFTAHIAAKLELEAPPPAQPRLDELQEEFLLLNAQHRRAPAERAIPPRAF